MNSYRTRWVVSILAIAATSFQGCSSPQEENSKQSTHSKSPDKNSRPDRSDTEINDAQGIAHSFQSDVPIKLEAKVRFENIAGVNATSEQSTSIASAIVIENSSAESWTLLTVDVNNRYRIFANGQVIQPGKTFRSELKRFVTREGLFFSASANKVEHVRISARIQSGSRATSEFDFNPAE